MKLRMRVLGMAVATAVATAGVVHLGIDYWAGSVFRPSASDRELQNNQVLFPDNSTTSGHGEDGSDSNDSFWEQDSKGEDSIQTGKDAGYLFEQAQQLPGEGRPTGALYQEGAVDAGTASDIAPENIYEITDQTDDPNRTDVIVPGDGTIHIPIITPSGDGDGGDGDGGSGGSDGGSGGIVVPGGGEDPGNGGDQGGDLPTPTPVPTPVTPSEEPIPGYGDASIDSPDNKNDATITPSFAYDEDVAGRANWLSASIGRSSYIQLYRGQKSVDEKAIFNALETNVMDDQYNTYEWTEDALGVYLRIDGVGFDEDPEIHTFPVDIPSDVDTVRVYISYRFHVSDPEWTSYVGYKIEDFEHVELDYLPYELSQGRVLLLNQRLTEEGQQINPDTILNRYNQYPRDSEGSTINLFRYQTDLLGANGTFITELFPGWKENGEFVDWFYPIIPGRHVLEPAGRVALDEDYGVQMRLYWMTSDGRADEDIPSAQRSNLAYLQTLTVYKGETEMTEDGVDTLDKLDVPDYVQAVEFPYYPYLSVGYLNLPSSVLYVNTTGVPSVFDDWLAYDWGLQVTQGYTVAEGNPNYTAEDGLLYNTEMTQILGVPTNRRELVVGGDVEKVKLPYQTQLETLFLEIDSVDDLPEINYDRLKRTCKIVVPDELLEAFMEAESAMLKRTHLQVAPASEYDRSFTVRGDFLFAGEDTIHRVLRTDTCWLTLPDGASHVEADALRAMQELTVLIMAKNGEPVTFEDGCFDGLDTLTTIACYSEAQLEAVRVSAPEGVKVKLVDAVREDGYSYLITEGGILLLAAPEDITSFDGTIPMPDGEEPLVAAAIGDAVFEDHDALVWVDLPEDCKMIGYQAFRGCVRLQGVMIENTEFILIGKDAFENCPKLRFVASNAEKCDLRDQDFTIPVPTEYGDDSYFFLFCPTVNEGYNGNWVSFTEDSDVWGYEMVDAGGTRVLYGLSGFGDPWIALRSGTDIDGTVTLPSATSLIFQYAFADATAVNDASFDVDWEQTWNMDTIGGRSFANSSIGPNMVLKNNVAVGQNAFEKCMKLKSVEIPGWGISLGKGAFFQCYYLESATLGDFSYYADGVYSDTFDNCSSLRDLTFLSTDAPDLVMEFYVAGVPFYFNNSNWDNFEAEEAHLTIHVPEGCEANYIEKWRYSMAGYLDMGYVSAYQYMWRCVESDLVDYENMVWPEADDVFAEVDRRLLVAENHVRALLGMDPTDKVEHRYRYEVDDMTGAVTLTSAKGVTVADLSAAEMDMPYGWTLDYIGADAFAESPNLMSLSFSEGLAGFHVNAFRGVESGFLMLALSGDTVPELLFNEGEAFDFGMSDVEMYVDCMFADFTQEDLIRAWTLPMTGYGMLEDLRAAVAEDLGEDADAEEVNGALLERLLAAENRVRGLLWMDPAEGAADMVFELPEELLPPVNYDDQVVTLPDLSMDRPVVIGPTDPTEPEQPTEPEEPSEPEQPAEPEEPTEPEQPAEPDNTDDNKDDASGDEPEDTGDEEEEPSSSPSTNDEDEEETEE